MLQSLIQLGICDVCARLPKNRLNVCNAVSHFELVLAGTEFQRDPNTCKVQKNAYLQIFGVMPFDKLQNGTELNG